MLDAFCSLRRGCEKKLLNDFILNIDGRFWAISYFLTQYYLKIKGGGGLKKFHVARYYRKKCSQRRK